LIGTTGPGRKVGGCVVIGGGNDRDPRQVRQLGQGIAEDRTGPQHWDKETARQLHGVDRLPTPVARNRIEK
jgi:hypothetical protein